MLLYVVMSLCRYVVVCRYVVMSLCRCCVVVVLCMPFVLFLFFGGGNGHIVAGILRVRFQMQQVQE